MDNELRNKLNVPGALALFALLTFLLIPLNIAYILIIAFMPSIYICVLIVIGYGALAAKLVQWFSKGFKVTNRFLSLIAVLIALLIGVYVKWHFWVAFQIFYSYEEFNLLADMPGMLELTFALMQTPGDVLYMIGELNLYGTWSYGEYGTAVTGVPLAILWVIEFFIMNGPAAVKPFQNKLVFIPEKNAWANPIYLPVAYDQFDSYELDALAAMNYHPVLDKPLSDRPSGSKTYRLAFLSVKGEWTGHVAVYKLSTFNKKTTETLQGNPIYLGNEECEKLSALFNEKFAPKPAPNVMDAEQAPAPAEDVEV